LKFSKLSKYGELKKTMGFDPAGLANTYEINEDNEGIVVPTLGFLTINSGKLVLRAEEVISVGKGLHEVKLAFTPSAGRYNGILIEVTEEAMLAGVVCNASILLVGETFKVYVRSHAKSIAADILALPGIIQCCAVKGEKF
jgi:hypothetical protein